MADTDVRADDVPARSADVKRAAAAGFRDVRGLPVVGSLLPISRNALRYFSDVLSRGDRAQLGFLGRRVLLLCHPRDIETVLVRDRDAYGRSAEIRKLRPLFGRGLLASDADLWRRQRASIAPSFGHEALASYARIMLAKIEQQLAQWKDGETHDIGAEMLRYTRESICAVLFGETFDQAPELARALTTVFGELRSEVLYLPLWRRLPTRRSRTWNRAVALLNRTIGATIRSRRASGEAHGDLLGALLQARDPLGNGMSDQQVHDEIMTFFLAGHETAAVSLSWACYLLARHPEMQERVADEVRAIAKDRELVSDDYPKLRFTTAVVKEALRLYPPVWSIGRQAVAHTALDGRPVPLGTDVWICVYRTHRDARWYAQPDRFVPDRWLDDPPPKPFTYLPFGMGPRVCIGQHFAMSETVLALAALFSRFRLKQTKPHPIEPNAWITLRPNRRIRLEAARISDNDRTRYERSPGVAR